MKKEAWLEHSSARFIYYSYKDSAFFHVLSITLIILACFLLIVYILIPQTQNWFSIRDEAIATRQRIFIINGNIAAISSLNKNKLEENRLTVISALPVEKDFASIINAIALSSAKSNVSVDDFIFGVGPISTGSATKIVLENGFNTTTLSLSLRGDINAIITFIKELGGKLPLSEVQSVDTHGGAINVLLVFYSKPYRSMNIPADKTINSISVANSSIIGTLSQWKADTNSFGNEPPIRSPQTPLF